MPMGSICLDCGAIVAEVRSGRCASCFEGYLERRRMFDRIAADKKKPVRRGPVSDAAKTRRAAHQAIIKSPQWRRVASMVKKRDGGCVRCGTTDRLTVHHIDPALEAANPYDPENCITLCASCHSIEDAARRRKQTGGQVYRGRGGAAPIGSSFFLAKSSAVQVAPEVDPEQSAPADGPFIA